MTSSVALFLSIVCIGAVTYLMRLSLLALHGRLRLPGAVERALRYVPAAALTALVVPALVAPAGSLEFARSNARLWAGILAVMVAWRTRSVVLTLAVGMGTLWVLSLWMH
jgi:branched-subunit amino acid transport protein